MVSKRPTVQSPGTRTECTAIRSPSDGVVRKLEISVEDGGVELSPAIEAITYPLPVCRGL